MRLPKLTNACSPFECKDLTRSNREQKVYTEGESNPPRVLDSVGNRLEGAHVTDTPSVLHTLRKRFFGQYDLPGPLLMNRLSSSAQESIHTMRLQLDNMCGRDIRFS
jgi:hypothetical protein